MRPRPRRASPEVRAFRKGLREAAARREALAAAAAAEREVRDAVRALAAERRREGAARYDALVDAGLAFDSAGGRPPPRHRPSAGG